MSPNGRRAWRRWAKKRLDIVDGFVSSAWLDVQYWNKWRRHRKSLNPHRTIGLLPPKPFTARSLVGMTMGARKRAAYYEALRMTADGGPISNRALRCCLRTALTPAVLANSVPLDYRMEVRAKYHIGERLRPCPGCCACWGRRISSAYGEHAECCGPQTSGKRKSQINAMRKWQEKLADDCNGSGVMPARKSK